MKSIKDDGLSQKASLNASTGFLLFIINTITSLVLNPILVNSLGTNYFGIWKSIDSFLGFASIADGKATQALKWTIANKEANNDFEIKKRDVGSALTIWFLFLPLLITIIGILTYFAPYLINHVSDEDYTLVRIIVILLGFNLIITPLFGISESVIVGVNKGYLANLSKLFWMIISTVLMYIMMMYHYGIISLAYIIIFITIMRGFHYFFIAKRNIEWFGIAKPNKTELMFFLKFSSWKLLWSFIARFLLSSEVVLFSLFIGANSVSQYVFTGYIPAIGITVSAILASSITPGLGRLIGNSEYKRSQVIVSQLRDYSFGFSLFIATAVLLFNKSFVSLWAGNNLFLGDISNILISLLMLQLILIRTEAFLIDLSLDIKFKVFIGLLTIGLIFICVLISYNYFLNNINGILIGILFGRFFMMLSFPIITNNMIHIQKYNVKLLKKIFFSILLLSLTAYIGSVQVFNAWGTFLLIIPIESIVCIIYIYILILDRDHKILLKNKILSGFVKYVKKYF